MKNRKITIISLLAALILTLAGCGEDEVATTTDATPTPGETITVNDLGIPALYCPIPYGFEKDEEDTVNEMYYTMGYPDDMTNMVVNVTEGDADGVNYTQESFQTLITESYKEAGFDISDFAFASFETGKLEEYDTLLIDYSYTFEGAGIRQIEYLVQLGNRTYALTFTEPGTADNYYSEAFLESIANVQIIYE